MPKNDQYKGVPDEVIDFIKKNAKEVVNLGVEKIYVFSCSYSEIIDHKNKIYQSSFVYNDTGAIDRLTDQLEKLSEK